MRPDLNAGEAMRASNCNSLQALNEERVDSVGAWPVTALAETLGRHDSEIRDRVLLPALRHWLFFLPRQSFRNTTPEHESSRTIFTSPLPLQSQCWIGCDIEWELDNPLWVGDIVHRVTRVDSLILEPRKAGGVSSVELIHDYHNERGHSLRERQRFARIGSSTEVKGELPQQPFVGTADWQREIKFDSLLLFRYSALTFNSNPLHYDRLYAAQEAGYPGLVIHNELVAILLLDLLRDELQKIQVIRYKVEVVRHTFDTGPLMVYGKLAASKIAYLWATDANGRVTTRAIATLA